MESNQNTTNQTAQPPNHAQKKSTNIYAILSLVFALTFTPLGVVFGFIALSNIKKTNESGRDLAIAGIIVSIVSLALVAAWIIFVMIALRNNNF